MDKHECSRVEIEPAENGGFSVRKFYRVVPEKTRGTQNVAMPYMEPKTFAFSTLDELTAFLTDAFSQSKDGRIVRTQG